MSGQFRFASPAEPGSRRDSLRALAFGSQRGARYASSARADETARTQVERARAELSGATAQARATASASAIAGLVAHFERLELEEFSLGLLLRRLGLLDLAEKLGDRALQIVAPDRGRAGIGRIGEMGGIGDARPLLLVGDFAIEIADHAGEFGHHHLDLPNPAALFLELKALQPNKRVPRLHSGALLNNPGRETTSPHSVHDYETARRCMRKVSPFLRQGMSGAVRTAVLADPLSRASGGAPARVAVVSSSFTRVVNNPGQTRAKNIFASFNSRGVALQTAAEPRVR